MHPLRAGLVIKSKDLLNEVHACLRPLPVRVVMEQPTLGETSLFLNQLEQARVDVLLIDLTRLAEPFEQVARRIKTLSAAPMIVALNDTADPEVILGAIRAGASEFLYPPLEAGLQKALERISSERLKQQTAGRQSGKILGFLSAKGGCGATTIACHVAVELQRATSQQVLLADMDLDTGMVGFLMKTKSQYSIMDAVLNVHRLDLSYWKALVSNGHEHLEVITAPQAASVRGAVDPDHFRQVLQFLRSAYDWVVVDLGRSASPLAFGVLDELDGLYLISTIDLPALHLSKQVVQNLTDAGFGRNRLHLVMNRAPKRSDILPGELQRVLGLPIFEFLPNDYPVLYEAYAEGSLLTANSELGKAMGALAMKIAGVKPKEKQKQKLNLSIF